MGVIPSTAEARLGLYIHLLSETVLWGWIFDRWSGIETFGMAVVMAVVMIELTIRMVSFAEWYMHSGAIRTRP